MMILSVMALKDCSRQNKIRTGKFSSCESYVPSLCVDLSLEHDAILLTKDGWRGVASFRAEFYSRRLFLDNKDRAHSLSETFRCTDEPTCCLNSLVRV